VFGPLDLSSGVTLVLMLGLVVPAIVGVSYGFFQLVERPFLENRSWEGLRESWRRPQYMETRWRRGAAMLLALVVAMSAVLVLPPRRADAAITNVWPANAEEDIYPDDLTTTDGLYAWLTTDTRGGRVCVIPATGPGSCDHPAFGEPNVVVGIGTMFVLLEGPELVTVSDTGLVNDRWQLVAVEIPAATP
jgi:hypothetical protein